MNSASLRRRGLTLVELLVVVTIMVILLGVVLPLAQPSLKGREVREASRILNTLFASARAKASADGRPAGIILTPSGDTDRCFQVAFAKTPPPFAGESQTWKAGFKKVGIGGWANLSFADLEVASVSPRLLRLIPDGDSFEVRFNYRGRFYKGIRQGNFFRVRLPGGVIPPGVKMFDQAGGGLTGGLPFQVFRSPRKSAASPVDLPVGSYIDLNASSDGAPTGNSIRIMFSPEGGIDQVYDGDELVASNEVYLLVANGKEAGAANLAATTDSLWVFVDGRTGNVRTLENVGGTTPAEARSASRAGPDVGGR